MARSRCLNLERPDRRSCDVRPLEEGTPSGEARARASDAGRPNHRLVPRLGASVRLGRRRRRSGSTSFWRLTEPKERRTTLAVTWSKHGSAVRCLPHPVDRFARSSTTSTRWPTPGEGEGNPRNGRAGVEGLLPHVDFWSGSRWGLLIRILALLLDWPQGGARHANRCRF